jgi:hypothetical protein
MARQNGNDLWKRLGEMFGLVRLSHVNQIESDNMALLFQMRHNVAPQVLNVVEQLGRTRAYAS